MIEGLHQLRNKAADLILDNASNSDPPVRNKDRSTGFRIMLRRFSSDYNVFESNKETDVYNSLGAPACTKILCKMERANSDILNKRASRTMVPDFSITGMHLGDLLSTGIYCDVRKAWNLFERSEIAENKQEEKTKTDESSVSLASSLCHEEKNQFVIKYIRSNIKNDPELYTDAVKALALEAEFLNNLNHPNIVKLCGLSELGFHGFDIQKDDEYFLLDGVSELIIDRLSKWKTFVKQYSNLRAKITRSGSKVLKQCFAERLSVALNLTAPLKYLHDHGMIYRDLKPENIGFNAQGNLKLFDFGFAREINSEQKSADGTYQLTGNIGTRQYMAPEMQLVELYNQSIDVYSFSIFLWELCSLEMAFEGMNEVQHFIKTCHFHARPTINPAWPKILKKLMKKSWSQNFHERPDFGAIQSELKQLNSKISVGKMET